MRYLDVGRFHSKKAALGGQVSVGDHDGLQRKIQLFAQSLPFHRIVALQRGAKPERQDFGASRLHAEEPLLSLFAGLGGEAFRSQKNSPSGR